MPDLFIAPLNSPAACKKKIPTAAKSPGLNHKKNKGVWSTDAANRHHG
jgi:hypothetical protein